MKSFYKKFNNDTSNSFPEDIYCFHLILSNKEQKFLCSCNKIIIIEDIKYYPYSGLYIEKALFNDSANNEITVHGVFEQSGIIKADIISGAQIKILYIKNGVVTNTNHYLCASIQKNDLDFNLKCVPETIKYGQSLLKIYSKTCRANFADNKCKIDIKKLMQEYTIDSINQNIIICNNINRKDGFFTGGTAFIHTHNNQNKYNIISHNSSIIEIDSFIDYNSLIAKKITLVPNCDKHFNTCCSKFNNAINFRGEPTIPDYKVLKNTLF